MRFCFFERFLLRNGEFVFEKVESVCLRERICFFLDRPPSIHPSSNHHPSIHPSILHRPGNKTVAIGKSDPRRPIYFPDIDPGVELQLPSTGEQNIHLSQPSYLFVHPSYPRSHTSRSLLHRTFLPRAPPAPGPADCSRPGHGVQVGGFMAIVNKLNQKYMGLALSSVSELGWMKSRNCSPGSV